MFSDSEVFWNYLLWGKAYYHLYFFSVLIQVSFSLPVLIWLVRRAKPTFGWLLAGSLAVQLVIFQANYSYAHVYGSEHGFLPFPGSCALWYVPPVLIGVWLGVHWSEWENVWSRWRWPFGAMAVFGLGFYLSLEVALLKGDTVNSRAFNFSFISYTTGTALILVAFSRLLAGIRGVGWFLAAVGNRSLGLFVVHPAVLFFIGISPLVKVFNYIPVPYFWLWLIVIGVSWVFVELAYAMRVGRLLFGRL